jgi:hypothetical protein
MTRRKTPRTGTWMDENGKHWFRVSGGAKRGPYESMAERDADYLQAQSVRVRRSPKRGRHGVTRY